MRTWAWAWSVLIGCGVLPGCAGESNPPQNRRYWVDDGALRDQGGHALLLRGINVHEQAKTDPEHLIPLDAAQRTLLLNRGFNSVRLLTFFSAVMPAEGQTDAAYLQRLADEVRAFSDAGLWVILDMHQDLWGEPFGDGAPGWACPDEIKSGYQPQEPWWVNYTSDQVKGCFDHFWSTPGLQDRWIDAWVAAASAACDADGLLGFDLFNEPYPGSRLGDSAFDPEVLYPLYRRAMDALEAACPERVFLFEPSANVTLGLTAAAEIAPGDRYRAVRAPHFYPQEVHEAGTGYSGDSQALRVAFEGTMDWSMDEAVWVGEWGGLTSNPNAALYFEHLTGLMLQDFVGGALWAYSRGDGGFSLLNASGQVKPEFDRACSLPLPVRLPARPTAATPDFDARTLDLTFLCKRDRGVTLQLPAGGWTLSYSPEGILELSAQDEHFLRLACTLERQANLRVAPR